MLQSFKCQLVTNDNKRHTPDDQGCSRWWYEKSDTDINVYVYISVDRRGPCLRKIILFHFRAFLERLQIHVV